MTTIRDQLKAAIFGQESSSGAADTSQENYATARGPMQVTKATFEGMKGKGLIPNEWSHADPVATTKAGNILIDTLADKYQDDPKKVAAAYYAGEKAVRADGSIADFRDKKNPKAPTTLQYAAQVLARMGGTQPVPSTTATVDTKANVLDAWTDGMPAADAVRGKGPALPKDIPPINNPQAPVLPAPGPSPAYAVLGQATEEAQAAAAEVDGSGFLDKAQASFMHSGITGAVLKQMVQPRFPSVPGYDPRVADKKLYEGRSADDHAFLDEANSPQDAQARSILIETRDADLRKVNLSGAGVGIAATLFGGLPEGYLTGIGAMRAFQLANVGALQLAAQGKKAAAIGSALGEQVAGNIATTALQNAFDPYVTKEDYAMAGGMGLAGWGLGLHGLVHAADSGAIREAGQRIMADAATKIEATRAQAVKNLGVNATDEALVAEVTRLEATSVRKQQAAAVASVPEDRQLLPKDMFEEKAEGEAKAAANDSQAESIKTGTEEKAVTGTDPMAVRHASESPNDWVQRDAARESIMSEKYKVDEKGKRYVAEHMEGVANLRWAEKQGPGVHVLPEFAANQRLAPVVDAVNAMAKALLPDGTITIGALKNTGGAMGSVLSTGKNVHLIALSPGASVKQALATAAHEVSHAVIHQKLRDASPQLIDALVREHASFTKALREGRVNEAKFKRFNENSPNLVSKETGRVTEGSLQNSSYAVSFDEWLAEGGTRFIQRDARGKNQVGLSAQAVGLMREAWEAVKHLWEMATQHGWISKDEAVEEFFQRALDGTLKDRAKVAAPDYLDSGLTLPSLDQNVVAPDIATKYGLNLMPEDSVAQKAEKQAVVALYTKADAWAARNPVDESRLKSLTDNSVFNVASTGMLMLKSDNPVVRMIASELLESASGAVARNTTAAIAKDLAEHKYMGNTINEVQGEYVRWRNQQGGNITGDFIDGKLRAQFDRLVAEEMESRLPGRSRAASSDQVVAAANSFEAAYERMRIDQQNVKTIGWASLPTSSVGYMPHKMSPEKVRNLTIEQEGALHDALVDQFIGVGYDSSFSASLSIKYIDRVKRRALGGYEAPGGIHQVGAADVVEEALNQMGLEREQVTAMMKKYMAGGAGHTKRRLQLDLGQEHPDGKGGTFTLMDLFDTDQLSLVRNQAQRVSGEVALARHGVMGKPGLAVLRRAMEFGENGKKAKGSELEAFDQVSAEFLGAPFGTQSGRWLDRAMQVNSLARLGGMGFTQFAEFINGITHVGLARSMSAVAGLPRLLSEARALARGEHIDNPFIGSIEVHGGKEFGTDAYKMVFPFDRQDQMYEAYGKDTLTFADRALRGATHLQGKLSFWRAIHAAQHRGMAEQIVHRAAKFLRDGGEDIALKDMGITADVAERFRRDLGNIATFDAAGNLQRFDITKATDIQAADQFVQAVHRGTSQIIQGTFIGETGKWAHSGVLKLMTQFRSFGITSVEKQWSRQVGNHGPAAALGILLGSMSIAAPIYIARTQLAAIGRGDREEYLDKQLTLAQIARASTNYVAMSGLAGDFYDAFSAVSGVGTVTGGRAGNGSNFVGNVVAPAAGLADDLWKGIQNTKEGTNPHDLLKAMPFARLPWMVPVINSLGK